MHELWTASIALLSDGGFVMPFLAGACALLWYALGWRAWTLRPGAAPSVADLGAYRLVIRSIVLVAPLAGLLGTVTGMIETFDALAEMAMFTQSGGIAGGISEALITTQMGLAVAIPGLVAGRLLDRRERTLREQA